MTRNDGRTRLFVGNLYARTSNRDLEHKFSRYGRVRSVERKRSDYAFVEFRDAREADEARYRLNGTKFYGNRIIVEVAQGVPRETRGGSERCFNCGSYSHRARHCSRTPRCFLCGQEDHKARDCCRRRERRRRRRRRSYSTSSSPVRRSRSRSPVRRRRRAHADQSSSSQSASRSPSPRRSRR